MRIQVFEGKNGWFVRLRSRNGKILNVSESYTRKASALRAAQRFRISVMWARVEVVD